MGEVYRARDSKLRRDVAVKVLPESLAADPDALARFEREAFAVAALSHPNILAIFDFGTHEAIAYSVMELLEGETLRDKLKAGPIAPRQAVDYALQIAKGLSAAHEKGVIHRDLKPENLFISKEGHVKILDFGLAKRMEAGVLETELTGAPTISGYTQPGAVMGTVGYMSPEQVRGLPADHRADIFSFGTILYEMLSGKKAFKHDSAIDTLSAIIRDDLPELSASGREISPTLDHIVRHCVEKDRDNRFQSARDVAFALSEQSSSPLTSGVQLAAPPNGRRRLPVVAVFIAVVALAAAGAALLLRSRGHKATAGGGRRVVVLPFENVGAPEDDYFADGIADEIRGKLTSLPGVEVIARASSTPYRKTAKSPGQIGEELQARFLLTATVRWEKRGSASRVHVSPELIDVSGPGPPTSKWQQPFDAPLTNVFEVQSAIATRVAQALGVALGAGQEKRLSENPTQNLAAYDAFLRGEEVSNRTVAVDPITVRKALASYEQAVALDPGFAQAWARVSWANTTLHGFGTPTPASSERAREAAEKAIALAPGRIEGYVALGRYQNIVLYDYRRALELYARAQRIESSNADLLTATAFVEEHLGRWDAAMEHFRQAERLDPRSVTTRMGHASGLLRLRRYVEARETIDGGLALAPDHLGLIESKAMTFLGEGDLERGRAVIESAPAEVEPIALVAFVADKWDLVWLLDNEQRELLLRLTPTAFDDDKASWGLSLLQADALKGDPVNLRAHAEETRKAVEEQLRAKPDDAQRHILLGIALAYLGRKEEAIREGTRGTSMLPVAKDALSGPYFQHQFARIYMLVGEPEKALDQLEPLLKIPYFLSPGWLKIDPNFDPLRKNPRFQKLVAGGK